jgi:hypothetical protein
LSTTAAPNYELIQQEGLETSLLEISMGPHHPSTHGVFRMDVKLDGETVVDLQPVFGYLHRNHEKLAENMTYLSSMPFTDRLDYFNSMTNNWAYALAAEKLIEIEVLDLEIGLQGPGLGQGHARADARRPEGGRGGQDPHGLAHLGHADHGIGGVPSAALKAEGGEVDDQIPEHMNRIRQGCGGGHQGWGHIVSVMGPWLLRLPVRRPSPGRPPTPHGGPSV